MHSPYHKAPRKLRGAAEVKAQAQAETRAAEACVSEAWAPADFVAADRPATPDPRAEVAALRAEVQNGWRIIWCLAQQAGGSVSVHQATMRVAMLPGSTLHTFTSADQMKTIFQADAGHAE